MESAMFYVSSVSVEGFWGKYIAKTNFFDDVSILIGKNGTGKTTFMDMLQAVLRVDLGLLYFLQFDEIIIKLKDKSKQRTISVQKESVSDRPYDIANFKIGKKSFRIPLHPKGVERYHVTHSTRITEEYLEIRDQIEAVVNVASLSVHRISNDDYTDEEIYGFRRAKQTHRPIIDKRIEQLSNALTTYQLSLAEKEKDVSSKFQKDVLTSMLFDDGFDRNIMPSRIELQKQKKQLTKAYRELGISDEKINQKIDKHFAELTDSLTNIKRVLDQGENIPPDKRLELAITSIVPLPLLKRTQHIINLSLEAEKEKQEIFKPIKQFLKIAAEFMVDKQLNIEYSTGKLLVMKDSKSIDLLDLSSGEKQLLILLIETLLQKNQPFVFLADEPEISLHIEWQEKIISSVKKLNSSAQIIVATHSPEIAGGWKDNIIDMEDIVWAD